MNDENDEMGRLIGGLGIICGTLLVYFARGGEAGSPDSFGNLALAIGVASAVAGLAVHVLGHERLERAVLTASGAVAGLALCYRAIAGDSSRADDTDHILWALGIVVVGTSATLIQWFRYSQSSAVAALAVGISLVLLVEESAALALFLLVFGMVFTDILGADDGPLGGPASQTFADADRRYLADRQAGPDHVRPGDEHLVAPRREGPPAEELARVGGSKFEEGERGLGQQDRHANSPAIRRVEGQAGDSAMASSEPLDPAEPTRVRPAKAMSLDDPYLTIGTAPKLLRSADVSPPQVQFTAPAGHQFDGFGHGPFVIRAASHVGTKHMHGGQGRQDAYAVTRNTDGRFIIAAVADGVGSEPRSALGAEWAVTSVVRNAAIKIDDNGLPPPSHRLAEMAAVEVERNAKEHGGGANPHVFSTTLVIAVVNTEDFTLQLTRVGDSNAFTRQIEGWANHFKSDDEPGAATNAIPASDPDIESSETKLNPGGCLLLASDGIADLISNSDEVHQSLHDVLSKPVSALEFSSIAGFQRRQAHDDQTALAIWRVDGSSK